MKHLSLRTSIEALSGVKAVHHLDALAPPKEAYTLLPFLCPFRYKPFSAVIDTEGSVTGVTTGYRKGITRGSQAKIDRVTRFWNEGAVELLAGSRIKFLMGDSDVYACCSIFPEAPPLPQIAGLDIVSNKAIWEAQDTVRELEDFVEGSYEDYAASIQEVILRERTQHLRVDEGMYHENVPEPWKERMIRRILSSYMLDGLLMRRGVYGPNPVILGVEASSTTIIQNAALPEGKKIPVIELAD